MAICLVQTDRHLTDNTLKCIVMNEFFFILIHISLKFVPKCPIDKSDIGSGAGLAPNRRQTITWTYADLDL